MATGTMLEAIFAALMLLLIIGVFIWACKPWRFFKSPSPPSPQAEDLERPLVSDDLDRVESQREELTGNVDLEESRIQIDVPISSSGGHELVSKQRLPSAEATQGVSLVLDGIPESLEGSLVGQTLKRPLGTNRWLDGNRSAKKEGYKNESTAQSFDNSQDSMPRAAYQRSSLILEVISGPSRGSHCFLQSTDTSRLPLTLGRVSPSDLLLKDGEVSGKHAMINWNSNKSKWELVDLGSLNGTLLNSMSIHNSDSGSRHWSEPIELSNGDIITLGTTSKITVQLTHAETEIPFGVAMASDPMSFRKGGKKLPMEDVCYYQWPLQGVEQFGVFGICDGHGGPEAAKAASKMLPEMIANILSISENRKRVLSHGDASDVLRNAFTQTESAMHHHQYEGCTATVLLVWADGEDDFCAQCANVGDSACLVNVCGRQIKMTEDHRITSLSERKRLNATGEPLKDGETRLCGLNLARMLGDKFLKEQDSRFSSEPYISQVVHIDKKSNAFALLASDGLWDVISVKKAMQLVLETRDRYGTDKGNMAEKIANSILSEARNLRTKDNTSIVLLDFNNNNNNDNTSRTK